MLYFISTTVYKYFVYKQTYVYNRRMCMCVWDYLCFLGVVKYCMCVFNTLVLALPKYGPSEFLYCFIFSSIFF